MYNPDQAITIVNEGGISPELLRNTLEVDMKALIEIHAVKCHDFEDIDSMVKRLVFNVYKRKHKSNTAACRALRVNRGTFTKWGLL